MRRVTLLALILALAVPAAAEAKALKAIWGPLHLPNDKPAGPVYKAIGLDVLQLGMAWSDVAVSRPANPRDPADPAYSWGSEIDQAVAMGKRYGFKVAVLVRGTPPWANGGKDDRYAPTDPKDFGDFMHATSRRYPGVTRWMVWGEPSRGANFQPMEANSPLPARRYARMLDSAYAGLKSADRRDVVVGGMTFTTGDVVPKDWIRWMKLPNGKPPRLDQYGHNPFSTRIPDLKNRPMGDGNYDYSDLDTLYAQVWKRYRKAYPRFRKRGPSIWISEFTIQAEHGSQDFNFYTSAAGQGEWIEKAFKASNSKPYISNVGWLGLLDEPEAPFNRTTGLLTYELKKKFSYYAFKRAP